MRSIGDFSHCNYLDEPDRDFALPEESNLGSGRPSARQDIVSLCDLEPKFPISGSPHRVRPYCAGRLGQAPRPL